MPSSRNRVAPSRRPIRCRSARHSDAPARTRSPAPASCACRPAAPRESCPRPPRSHCARHGAPCARHAVDRRRRQRHEHGRPAAIRRSPVRRSSRSATDRSGDRSPTHRCGSDESRRGRLRRRRAGSGSAILSRRRPTVAAPCRANRNHQGEQADWIPPRISARALPPDQRKPDRSIPPRPPRRSGTARRSGRSRVRSPRWSRHASTSPCPR